HPMAPRPSTRSQFFFFSSRRRHTRWPRDWSSDVCSSDLKGKQVRDQIHSSDVLAAFAEFTKNPKPGEVYNLGGGRENSASILECIEKIQGLTGKKISWKYLDQARVGDHICYISDLTKFKT